MDTYNGHYSLARNELVSTETSIRRTLSFAPNGVCFRVDSTASLNYLIIPFYSYFVPFHQLILLMRVLSKLHRILTGHP